MPFLPPNQQRQSTEGTIKRYNSEKHFSGVFFTYKVAAEINWHRYGTKLRHCHFMYLLST